MPAKPKPGPQEGITPGAAKIVAIQVKDLYRDPLVNPREPGDAWIEARSGERYSRPMVGVLQVSLRDGEDGRKRGPAVVDGWNRRMLVMKNEGPDAEVDCEVFQGLTLREEARMFLGHNNRRHVHAVPRFLAEVTAGEIVPVQVAAIVEAAGFTIGEFKAAGVLICVAEMTRIHARDKQRAGTARRPQALQRTLECIQAAYRPSDPAFYRRNDASTHVALIGGTGTLFVQWGDHADTTRMARTLGEWKGGANGLLQQANGAKDVTPGLNTAAKGVAYLVGRAYNKGLSSSALPVPFSK